MPKKSGRWWFWRKRESMTKQVTETYFFFSSQLLKKWKSFYLPEVPQNATVVALCLWQLRVTQCYSSRSCFCMFSLKYHFFICCCKLLQQNLFIYCLFICCTIFLKFFLLSHKQLSEPTFHSLLYVLRTYTQIFGFCTAS